MNSLEAIVFDAYGTLFDVHSVIAAAEKAFPGRGEALSQLWRQKQLEYSWLRSLIGSYADFWQVTRDALGYACQALGLECPDELQDCLMEEYLHLSTFPEVEPALEALSSRRLAVLSNGSPLMLSAAIASSGLSGRFSDVISVDEVGIYKPSARVYQLAPSRLGIPKEKIGFVTSNYFDVAGAKAFGFYVYWVRRSTVTPDLIGVLPDKTITRLTELAS